jgi:hypothetical protein
MRSEFLALISEDKDQFRNELNNILVSLIEQKISKKYLEEASKLLEKITLEPKVIAEQTIVEQEVPVYMPIDEINNAINNNRTNWLLAKDGSQLEVTPDIAKYLAELYKSLNNTHKDKLVKLITESDHGFKKAVKTAENLYRRHK